MPKAKQTKPIKGAKHRAFANHNTQVIIGSNFDTEKKMDERKWIQVYIDGCHVEIKKMKAPSCYPCCITLGRPAYHVFVVAVDAIVLLFPHFSYYSSSF